MNTFVDCPHCGSEFVIDDEVASANLRCPDCLQWVSSFFDDSPRSYAASYAAGHNDRWEDFGYEAGYDY